MSVEGLAPIPNRPGWYLGEINHKVVPEVPLWTNVTLVHESGRSYLIEMPGHIDVDAAVAEAQARILEWES